MQLKSNIITIDCDEVLCDTVGYMSRHTSFFWSQDFATLTLEDLTAMYGYIHEHLDELLEADSDMLQHMQAVDWVQEWVARMVKAGYRLFVVTGRTDNMQQFTYQWLEQYFPDMIADVFFCNNYQSDAISKAEVCLRLGSGLMIDDDPRFIASIQDIPVLLFDKPWNASFSWTHAQKVGSWAEIGKMLEV